MNSFKFKVGQRVRLLDIEGKYFLPGQEVEITECCNDKYTYDCNCYQVKNSDDKMTFVFESAIVAAGIEPGQPDNIEPGDFIRDSLRPFTVGFALRQTEITLGKAKIKVWIIRTAVGGEDWIELDDARLVAKGENCEHIDG